MTEPDYRFTPPPMFDIEPEPEYVHGIVSDDPWTIRCDGCGHEATGERIALLVLTCGILFNPRDYQNDTRRLCLECRTAAAWEGP